MLVYPQAEKKAVNQRLPTNVCLSGISWWAWVHRILAEAYHIGPIFKVKFLHFSSIDLQPQTLRVKMFV